MGPWDRVATMQGVRASPGQSLSHFHLGLMGVTEIRKKRLLSTTDLMWVNLADNAGRATPFPDVPTISARVGFNQFILTPKVGFRAINNKTLRLMASPEFAIGTWGVVLISRRRH